MQNRNHYIGHSELLAMFASTLRSDAAATIILFVRLLFEGGVYFIRDNILRVRGLSIP